MLFDLAETGVSTVAHISGPSSSENVAFTLATPITATSSVRIQIAIKDFDGGGQTSCGKFRVWFGGRLIV
jgi:hypothetical protein